MSTDNQTTSPASARLSVAGAEGTLFAAPKTFSTGSRGFYGVEKLTAPDGRRYQVTLQVVEIGSKPDTTSKGRK